MCRGISSRAPGHGSPVTASSPGEASDVPSAPHRDRDDDPHRGSRHRHRGRAGQAPASPGPTASVLIPAHNEAATIGRVIRACYASGYPLDDVIVVADSCTDATAAIARAEGATIVLETALADKASAQNQALPLIRSEVVVGIDGDTLPQPGCIPLMIADIAAGADATCSTVLPLQPSGFFVAGRRFAYALARRWWRLCQAKVGRIQVLTGCSYAFRTDAMRSIGGFPAASSRLIWTPPGRCTVPGKSLSTPARRWR